jgi:hypothetical protein
MTFREIRPKALLCHFFPVPSEPLRFARINSVVPPWDKRRERDFATSHRNVNRRICGLDAGRRPTIHRTQIKQTGFHAGCTPDSQDEWRNIWRSSRRALTGVRFLNQVCSIPTKSRHGGPASEGPLYPRIRTSSARLPMSVKCGGLKPATPGRRRTPRRRRPPRDIRISTAHVRGRR